MRGEAVAVTACAFDTCAAARAARSLGIRAGRRGPLEVRCAAMSKTSPSVVAMRPSALRPMFAAVAALAALAALAAVGAVGAVGAVAAGCGAQVRPVSSAASRIAHGGGLSQKDVDDAVTTHLPAVRACYERRAAAEGRPMGVVRFAWRIETSGAVSNVALVASTLHSGAIETCIADEVGRWQFPTSQQETEITEHPFAF